MMHNSKHRYKRDVVQYSSWPRVKFRTGLMDWDTVMDLPVALAVHGFQGQGENAGPGVLAMTANDMGKCDWEKGDSSQRISRQMQVKSKIELDGHAWMMLFVRQEWYANLDTVYEGQGCVQVRGCKTGMA